MIDITSLSVSELSELIAAATSELASRQTVSGPRRVAIRYPSYNSRRYSRPWIARIIRWPVGGKPDLEFGSYCGDDKGGEVEIMAKPGDIIRDGQRDGRGNGGTNDWSVVEADYTVRKIDQAEGRKLFSAQ